jgi:hypothetical protein
MFHIMIRVLLFAILAGVAPRIAGGLLALVCAAVGLALFAFSILVFAGLYGWQAAGLLAIVTGAPIALAVLVHAVGGQTWAVLAAVGVGVIAAPGALVCLARRGRLAREA